LSAAVPVGLSLALDLAWRGNRSTLIEREPGTGVELLGKANGLHERTMETCRRWGLVQKVMEVGFRLITRAIVSIAPR
jgi:2-polyprenyl-6-methoxyphenol hydroxylase-like FAD-dependent oxidoreductase